MLHGAHLYYKKNIFLEGFMFYFCQQIRNSGKLDLMNQMNECYYSKKKKKNEVGNLLCVWIIHEWLFVSLMYSCRFLLLVTSSVVLLAFLFESPLNVPWRGRVCVCVRAWNGIDQVWERNADHRCLCLTFRKSKCSCFLSLFRSFFLSFCVSLHSLFYLLHYQFYSCQRNKNKDFSLSSPLPPPLSSCLSQ